MKTAMIIDFVQYQKKSAQPFSQRAADEISNELSQAIQSLIQQMRDPSSLRGKNSQI